MRVVIAVVDGPALGREVPMQSGERATFGRGTAADVCLPDPDMAAIQFSLVCGSETCEIRSVSQSPQVFVNDERVQEATLAEGDQIRAGQSRFNVKFSLMPVTDVPQAESTSEVAKDTRLSLQALCEIIELDEEGMQLRGPGHTVESFVDVLVGEQRYEDAVRLLAHAMSKSMAVRWAHEGIVEIGSKDPRGKKDRIALRAIEKWVEDEAEENRRLALQSAEELEFLTAPACAAAAAGWSGGSMVPPDLDPIEPDRLLTARMASIAIQIAALETDDDAAPERYKRVIKMGQSMLSAHLAAA